MGWKKLGKIFEANGQYEWMKTHSTVPVALHLNEDIYRIYFSTRDKLNRNQIASIEIDINKPKEYFNLTSKPHLKVGEDGHFDCDGVYGTSIVKKNSELWMFYGGWNSGQRGLFYSSIGLAKSVDNGLTFTRVRKSPILSRDEIDPWAVMAPYVIMEDNKWKMWYTSGIEIKTDGNSINSKYDVKLAISQNGVDWKKQGKTSIPLGPNDTNIARACVIKNKNNYNVWYPVVSKTTKLYRIGYGESKDGILFTRKDEMEEAKLIQSENKQDWDGTSVTYPFVFKHKRRFYMLYNGNEFGKTGFGLAKWNK
jgi:hypothetical protein